MPSLTALKRLNKHPEAGPRFADLLAVMDARVETASRSSIEISRSLRMVIPAKGSMAGPLGGPPRLPLRDRDLEPLRMVDLLPNAGAFGVLC